ncbi:MAG: hypothetical protein ACYTG6_10150, partial [Planctomycetota bacterium]|jgi:hypothetical protein
VAFVPTKQMPGVDPTALLRDMMSEGPTEGTWRVEGLMGTREWCLAPHPTDEASVYVGRRRRDGTVSARKWSRRWIARMFVPGPEELFFRNYRLSGPLETVTDEEGASLLMATWVPRRDQDGGTARRIWIDGSSGEIVRVEDRSRLDHVIRKAERVASEATPMALPDPDASSRAGSRSSRGRRSRWGEPNLGRVAGEAGFTLLAPTYIPPGFELMAAAYRAWPLPPEPGADPETRRRIMLAYQLYSDGLATISIGIAPAEEMNALERAVATMRAAEEEEGACPTLPDPNPAVDVDGIVIRRRRDMCRTVLRIDDLHGVSVALLGQNEIPEDEYVTMVSSLEVVEPAPAGDDEGDR